MKAKEVAQRLADQAEGVCRRLLPRGKQQGAEWLVGGVDGEAGQSLRIHLSGAKSGVWCDFAVGSSGDLLDLWAAVKGLSIGEAIREAKNYLGIVDVEFHGRTQTKPQQRPEKINAQPVKPGGSVFKWLTEVRKLSPEAIAKYRLMESGRTVAFPYFKGDEIVFCKFRSIDDKKNQWTKGSPPCLFGWQAIPREARSLVLCEGELDALAWWMLGYPAMSVPTGVKGLGWIETEFVELERFDEINLAFDADPEGADGVMPAADRLGCDRCRVVNTTPYKDANDLVKAGVPRETVAKVIAAAGSLDPSELRKASEFVNDVIREFYPPADCCPSGFEAPWRKASGKFRFRYSELTVVNGINGHGKSQMTGQLVLSAAEQGERVCIYSGELKPARTLWRLCRQVTAMEEPSVPYIEAVHRWYQDRIWIFNLVGSAKAERLLEVFRYARKRYGIRVFVIDSFMKCGIDPDDYAKQKHFVEALCDFKNEFDCHVLLITHPRKADDEFKPPGKMDVAGAGAITDLADNVTSIFRMKAKENKVHTARAKGEQVPEEILAQPDALFFWHKQRNGEWENSIALWWDQASFQFLESAREKPHQYLSQGGAV